MRPRSQPRRLQLESLEHRLALAANLAVDVDITPTPISQLAMVGSELYFSTTNGTETQIRRYANGSLTQVAQHQVFAEFGSSEPSFMFEIGNGLMYGLTDPFFTENLSDASFQVWHASAGRSPQLVRELPVMDRFGAFRPPTDFAPANGSVLLQDASERYLLIDGDGDTRDTWSAPFDQTCRAPNYGPAHVVGGGLAIEATYSSSCGTFLTPISVHADGASFEEIDLHPSSLYLPNGTLITSEFTREAGAEELIFKGTNRSETIKNDTGGPLEPEGLTRLNVDTVFFTGNDQHGREPWITDGTLLGTRLLRDINGLESSHPKILGKTPRGLIFSAANNANGNELWITDGTEVGTRLLKDIRPGQSDSNPIAVLDSLPIPNQPIEDQSDRIFFWAQASNNDRELWSTDGSPSGTQRVASRILGPSSELTAMAELPNGRAVMGFSDDDGNMQVWTSDGTAAGTRRMGSLPESGRVARFSTSTSNDRFVAVQLESNEIWRLDVATGTANLVWSNSSSNQTFGSNPKHITALGNRILFTTDAEQSKSSVWVWDPARKTLTSPGIIAMQKDITIHVLDSQTAIFTEFNAVRVLKNDRLSALGSQLLLQHESVGQHSYLLSSVNELTIVAADLTITRPSGQFSQLTVHDGQLYAINQSRQLVRFNGTRASLVGNTTIDASATLLPGPRGSMWVLQDNRIQRLDLATFGVIESLPITEPLHDVATNANGKLFWRSLATRSYQTLTNGRVQSLQALGDIQNIEQTIAVGNKVFFVGANSRQKRSLWVADGTQAGSRKLADVPGLGDLTTDGTKLFFTGNHAIWESDGTVSGTRPFSKVESDIVGATASGLTVIGNELYFVASDGIHGKEPFSITLSGAGPSLPGDATRDNQVGFDDFLVLSANFGKTTSAGAADADFNDDGRVGFTDFLVLSTNFSRQL